MAEENSKNERVYSRPELQELQDLYDLMVREGLDTVELQKGDSRIRLSRATLAHALEPVPHRFSHRPHPEQRESPEPVSSGTVGNGNAITAPLAGVFYRASSPSGAPFVKEGDVVDPGQTLCIVEAMKVMNEIKAEQRCRIVKIVAENSRPVSAGQALFFVESSG